MMGEPSLTVAMEVEIDHGQVYIYSESPYEKDPESDAVLRALDDAWKSRRFVGVADGLIDLVTPVQWNFHAPMRIEVWSAQPPSDEDNWDHVVDVDFDVSNNQVIFQGSGGLMPVRCGEPVPSGAYRARVAGRGYTEVSSGAEGLDSYRLQLWPREARSAPALRRAWPGFQAKAWT
ncbi:MAG: hypothetical protein GEV28_05000 [Actinophytocola sp.]|uniref:hypothetical protein n=1 Tax=Actinophytocola sp. TaxID=1872138 RepID=UPI0013253297|nr:hypothetical protein [Actinophytocola sp.]MPZ79776.1 hypothetical protein [Actinophytocola sp.]